VLTASAEQHHDAQSDVEVLEPTPFQNRVLALPETINLLLGGGRGGGKSECAKFIAIKHCVKYGKRARIIYVRETWEATAQFEEELALLIIQIYGEKVVAYHKTDHTFTWPSGASIKISQLADEKDYAKFQGKSFTMVICDEYGAMANTKWLWLLASNIRAKHGTPCRMVLLANPGGPQHGHIQHEFIAKTNPWGVFERKGEPWIFAPSTLLDNPHIDRSAYIRKLRTACGSDEELLKAWISGDWNIARGAYFAGSLEEDLHMLPIAETQPAGQPPLISALCPYPLTRIWRPFIAHDWGSGAPSVTYVCGISPGVPMFPKGSLLLVDELATHETEDLNVGLNWAPDKLAEGIKGLCKPWGVFPAGVGDDAYGLEETLLRTLAKLGIFMRRPDKDRVAGWQLMREMFDAVRQRNGNPGMYISARCRYFWRTVPFLIRDPKYPEDIVTKNVPDHGADAGRYAAMSMGRGIRSGTTEGMH
jgi:hypothetical protein